jgi:hypothetical protein
MNKKRCLDIINKEINILFPNGDEIIIKLENDNLKISDLINKISNKINIHKYNINLFTQDSEIPVCLNHNIIESKYLIIIDNIINNKLEQSNSILYNYCINIDNFYNNDDLNNNDLNNNDDINNLKNNINNLNKFSNYLNNILNKMIEKKQSNCVHDYDIYFDIYDKIYTCKKCNYIK